jgi:hypothetical protein
MSEQTPRGDVPREPDARPEGPDISPRPPSVNVLSWEVGRLRQSLPLIVGRCMAFSAMTRFDEDLISAVREFYGLELDVATAEAEILEDEDERVRFFPWFLWDWRTEPGLPTIGERFLSEGDHAPHEERLLDALCQSCVGFYEALEDATPVGVRLRDMATGDVLQVEDEGLAGDLFAGHILQARLVGVEGEGPRPLVLVDAVYACLPPEAATAVRVELESFDDGSADVVDSLKSYVAEMLHFADHLLESLARPPEALNGDGQPLVLCQSTVKAPPSWVARQALDGAPDRFRASGDGLWAFTPPEGGGATLGFIDAREAGRVVLAANSPARLDALGGAFTDATGITRPGLHSVQDFDAAVERWAERGGGDIWLALDPDVQRAVQQWLQSWARTWLDMPPPFLDDRTPREAVREGDGRRRVEAMLTRFERLQRGRFGAEAGVRIDVIRAELGL